MRRRPSSTVGPVRPPAPPPGKVCATPGSAACAQQPEGSGGDEAAYGGLLGQDHPRASPAGDRHRLDHRPERPPPRLTVRGRPPPGRTALSHGVVVAVRGGRPTWTDAHTGADGGPPPCARTGPAGCVAGRPVRSSTAHASASRPAVPCAGPTASRVGSWDSRPSPNRPPWPWSRPSSTASSASWPPSADAPQPGGVVWAGEPGVCEAAQEASSFRPSSEGEPGSAV